MHLASYSHLEPDQDPVSPPEGSTSTVRHSFVPCRRACRREIPPHAPPRRGRVHCVQPTERLKELSVSSDKRNISTLLDQTMNQPSECASRARGAFAQHRLFPGNLLSTTENEHSPPWSPFANNLFAHEYGDPSVQTYQQSFHLYS